MQCANLRLSFTALHSGFPHAFCPVSLQPVSYLFCKFILFIWWHCTIFVQEKGHIIELPLAMFKETNPKVWQIRFYHHTPLLFFCGSLHVRRWIIFMEVIKSSLDLIRWSTILWSLFLTLLQSLLYGSSQFY